MYKERIRCIAAIFMMAVFSSGCTSKPPAASMAAGSAVSPSSTTAPVAAPAAAITKSDAGPKGSTVYPGVTPELVAQYRRQGYRPVVRNGTTLFCRQGGTLGTRFEHTTCSTAEQMAAAAASGRDFTETLQRQSGLPPPKN